MLDIIEDFIKCGKAKGRYSGFFEGDVRAIKLSAGISKSQSRKYRRYGQIPSDFIKYLQEIGVVLDDENIYAVRTVQDILDLLWKNRKQVDDWNLVQFFREKLLNKIFPGLRGVSCTQYGLWEKIINSKILK